MTHDSVLPSKVHNVTSYVAEKMFLESAAYPCDGFYFSNIFPLFILQNTSLGTKQSPMY